MTAEIDKCCEGMEAADHLLKHGLGMRLMAKAIDLTTGSGFDEAVALLASRLRRSASVSEKAAVAAALRGLDIDWGRSNPEVRRRLIEQSLVEAGRKLAMVPTKIETRLGDALPSIFRAGKRDVRRFVPKVGIRLTAVDEEAIRAMRSSAALFVTDEMGRRVDSFGEAAKDIVAQGMEAGWGRKEISEKLAAAANGKIAKGGAYWDVIAGAFVGRARSWSQLIGYDQAEISRYRVVAILDQATTQICRFLDGQVFDVREGLNALGRERTLSRPEQIKESNPWVRERRGEDGKRQLYVTRDGQRVPIATVERAGSAIDDRGEFSGAMGERDLVNVGLGPPPYHGLCRSTTVPVF
jgi:hypothetical protein